jgi:hypothetical protein
MMTELTTLIPQCISSSFEFLELNDARRRDLEAKVNYCREVEKKLGKWLTDRTDTLESLLDDLELDGFSILSTGFGDTDNHISAYLFHSSWTFECQKETLNELISSKIKKLLGKPLPSFNASADEIVTWLQEWATALAAANKTFITAQSFELAIATMITIDSMLLAMLSVTTAARLNVMVK